jgi:hypothetical protein
MGKGGVKSGMLAVRTRRPNDAPIFDYAASFFLNLRP